MSDTPDRVKRFFEQRQRAEEGTWTIPDSMAPGSASRASDLPPPPQAGVQGTAPAPTGLQSVRQGPQILSDHVVNPGASSTIPPIQYPLPAQYSSRPVPHVGTLTAYTDAPSTPSGLELMGYGVSQWFLRKLGVAIFVGGAATLKFSVPGGVVLIMLGVAVWVGSQYIGAIEDHATETMIAEMEKREQEAKARDQRPT